MEQEEESIYVSMYKDMPTEELTLEDFEMHAYHRLEGSCAISLFFCSK
jgi:hypothetical protein